MPVPNQHTSINKNDGIASVKPEIITRESFEYFFNQSAVPFAILKGSDHYFTFANPAYIQLLNGRQLVGKTLLEAIPELKDQPFVQIIKSVFETGEPFHSPEIAATAVFDNSGEPSTRYFNLCYTPYRDEAGQIEGVMVLGYDLTKGREVRLTQNVQRENEQAYNLLRQAPVAVCIVKGPNFVIEFANELVLELWRKNTGIIGKPILEALPEIEGQGFIGLLDDVRRTGEPFFANERVVHFDRNGIQEQVYMNFVYQPYYEVDGTITGVMAIATEVTEQVNSRKKVEEVRDALKYRNALFEAQMEATSDGILIVDEKRKVIFHNRNFVKIWNMPAHIIESGMDKVALEFAMTQLADPKGFIDRVDYLYSHADERSNEEIVFADGRVIERSGRAVLGEDATYYGWAWYFKDITAEKENKEKLRYQHNLVQAISHNATLALFVVDALDYCTYINPAAQNMLGYSFEEISEKTFHDMVHHHHKDGSEFCSKDCPVVSALERGKSLRSHIDTFITKDGRFIPISCNAVPIYENGVHVSSILEVRDISKELEAEQILKNSAIELEKKVQERTIELQQANERLEYTNKELEQFAYAASHDMQEPLRKIQTFISFLEKEGVNELSEKGKTYISKIGSSAGRMKTIINDLLQYSNQKSNDDHVTAVDLNEIVAQVESDLELVINQKNVVIQAAHLPTIQALRGQVNQLFYNLIFNSIKFAKNDIPAHITITAKNLSPQEVEERTLLIPDKDYIQISFSDNGIGFSQEHSKKIFQLFTRLHGKAEYEGSGIGLGLCKKIVQNHKGHIYAVSEPGEGATFHIILPVL
jgi:PAS domain S-box-containing protein